MIARFYINLPFDLFITEADTWVSVELASGDYTIRVHPPFLNTSPPNPTASMVGYSTREFKPPTFSDNVLVNGCRVAQVNVLAIDFIKPEFSRSDDPSVPREPLPELAFEIANEVLGRIRVYSRAFQIKPLVKERDLWALQYLNDDMQQLEEEKGKIRGFRGGALTMGPAALTPEIMQMVRDRWQTGEPYVWDQLLLDARALLPEVGAAVVLAAAALETFIPWALDILHAQCALPEGLWDWINNRGDFTKDPSVSDRFDALLHAFTGRSLKDDEPDLWQYHAGLRNARNGLVHQGVATIGKKKKPVDPAKAKELVEGAEKIVAWVEDLLPEAYRRAQKEAIGPFARRFATPDEAAVLGPAYVAGGSSSQAGLLKPGESIVFGFERGSDSSTGGEQTKTPGEDPNPKITPVANSTGFRDEV